MLEARREDAFEVRAVVLDQVKGIGRGMRGPLRPGRRHEQHAVPVERLDDAVEERWRIAQMLDHLEGTDDLVGAARQRFRYEVDAFEGDVRPTVALARIGDRLCVDVDPDDPRGPFGEVGGAVADTAAGIEDRPAIALRCGELVTLQMVCDDAGLGLVRNDALGIGHSPSIADAPGRTLAPEGRRAGRILSGALAAVRNRISLDTAAACAVAVAVFAFACGSTSVSEIAPVGRAARWAMLLILFGVGVAAALRRRRRSPIRVVAIPAVALACLALLSAAWSVSPRLTIERAATLILLIFVVWLLAGSVRHTALADGMLVGAVAVALAGLVTLAAAHDAAVQAATYEYPVRYRGFGEDPNTVPLLLGLALPLAARRLVGHRRIWAALALALFFGSIVASGSRGGLAAGCAGLVVFALASAWPARRRLAVAAAVIAAFAGGAALTTIPRPLVSPASSATAAAPKAAPKPRYLDAGKVRPLDEDVGRDGASAPLLRRTLFGSSGRTAAWRGAIAQAAGRPLLGYGFGTEARVFVDRYYSFVADLPENSYVGLALQLGLAGVVLLAALLAGLALAAHRATRAAKPGMRGMAAAMAGAVAAGMVSAVAQSYIYSVGNIATSSLWLCGAVLAVAAAEAR